MTYLNGETPEREVRQIFALATRPFWCTAIVGYYFSHFICHLNSIPNSLSFNLFRTKISYVLNRTFFSYFVWLLSVCGTFSSSCNSLLFLRHCDLLLCTHENVPFIDSDWFPSPFVAPDWLIHYQVSCVLPLCFSGLMPATRKPKLDLVYFLLLALHFWWESLEF